MGLDASVMCNCFKLGSFNAPPFPREWLELDEAGDVSLRREFDTQEYWTSFYEWIQTCCQHPGMEYSSEHISNWAGYRLFQEALEKVGWEHFPTLARELPNENGGLTSPSAAKDALTELEYFHQPPTPGLTHNNP